MSTEAEKINSIIQECLVRYNQEHHSMEEIIKHAISEAKILYCSVDVIKEYRNVKTIVFNIKEGENKEPTMLASKPDGGLVKEYSDRYEWDIIHHQGLSLLTVNKRDFISVEILL